MAVDKRRHDAFPARVQDPRRVVDPFLRIVVAEINDLIMVKRDKSMMFDSIVLIACR